MTIHQCCDTCVNIRSKVIECHLYILTRSHSIDAFPQKKKKTHQSLPWERTKEREIVYIYIHVHREQPFQLIQLSAKMMFILQNIYMISVPIAMIFTTIAMLLPCWWSSETLQVGLWRARSISSSWITIEPDTDTQEGRYPKLNEHTFVKILSPL